MYFKKEKKKKQNKTEPKNKMLILIYLELEDVYYSPKRASQKAKTKWN